MSLDNRPTFSGGCQCGAVRFHLEGAIESPSVCHCRMCQKAAGNLYLTLVGTGDATLEWTRGQPKRFQSSNHVKRGFCAECGTPLTFETPEGMALTVGAFDDPSSLAPTVQWGREAALPYVDSVPSLPGHDTFDDTDASSYLLDIVSYQHPDHDTDQWPLEKRA
jgi:hypothetical protein